MYYCYGKWPLSEGTYVPWYHYKSLHFGTTSKLTLYVREAYHFIGLASHGPVHVARSSEVDQGQGKLRVRHHHDVNAAMLGGGK